MSESESVKTDKMITAIEEAMQRLEARPDLSREGVPVGLNEKLKYFLSSSLAFLAVVKQQEQNSEHGSWSTALEAEADRLEAHCIEAANAASEAIGAPECDEPPEDAGIQELLHWRRSQRQLRQEAQPQPRTLGW